MIILPVDARVSWNVFWADGWADVWAYVLKVCLDICFFLKCYSSECSKKQGFVCASSIDSASTKKKEFEELKNKEKKARLS